MRVERSQLKTTLKVVGDAEKRASAGAVKLRFSEQKFQPFAKVESGVNEFRVLPTLDGSSPYQPFSYSLLEVNTNEYDENGNVIGQVVKNKRVFLATVHSDKSKGKDPIATYLKYVTAKASENFQNYEDRRKFLMPVYGFRGKDGKFVWGITPMQRWCCYVWKDGEIQRLELNDPWFKEMNKISADLSSDDVLVLDVFSDPDEGYPLLIDSYKEDGKNKYRINAKQPSRGESWEDFFAKNRIPDEVLEKLADITPLKKMFVDSYTDKDFSLAVEGLKRFDRKHPEYGIFDDPNFIAELEEQASIFGSIKEEGPIQDGKFVGVEEPVKHEKFVEEEKPKAPSISKAKMKVFLRDYIEEKYPGNELPTDLSDESIEYWYKLAQNDEELPWPSDLPFDEDLPQTPEKPITNTPSPATMDRIRRIREARAKKQE